MHHAELSSQVLFALLFCYGQLSFFAASAALHCATPVCLATICLYFPVCCAT